MTLDPEETRITLFHQLKSYLINGFLQFVLQKFHGTLIIITKVY